MTTAVDDGLIPRNPVSIKGGSAERTIERPLLTGDDVRALAGAIHPRLECPAWTAAASGLRFGLSHVQGGSRLAIVFNGSPLFTGAAGSGR